MKILFPIGTLYPSQEGGPSNTVYWMAKALAAKGIEVSLVTTNRGAENLIDANTWLSTPYGKAIYYSERWHTFPLRLIFNAIKQLRRHDCVHLTSLFYPPSFIIATAAVFQKKPIIWSCRGNLNKKALVYSSWKKKPVLWFIKKLLSGPRMMFHATSDEESMHIRELIGMQAKVVEIPNYIELPLLLSISPASPPYLLYVGRIHPVKALDILIDALALSEFFMFSGFVLKIAGDDANDYGARLKKQVAELGLENKVEFSGHIEGERKQRLYANARFTLLPSHTENFGNVVIESLAQGTPVIASKGTPWQVLESENAGFHVDNTPEKLGKAIDRALALDPETYAAYRANAYRLATTRFDIHQNIQVWIDAYRAILQK